MMFWRKLCFFSTDLPCSEFAPTPTWAPSFAGNFAMAPDIIYIYIHRYIKGFGVNSGTMQLSLVWLNEKRHKDRGSKIIGKSEIPHTMACDHLGHLGFKTFRLYGQIATTQVELEIGWWLVWNCNKIHINSLIKSLYQTCFPDLSGHVIEIQRNVPWFLWWINW